MLARGDDLDDVLDTMARGRHPSAGDPRRDPETARELVAALRGVDRRTETTNVVAVDADGNVCTITTSLGLGSGVWVPGFGVHLNIMMGEGELIRGTPVPGTRLGSMMSPLVALDAEHRPVVAAGAAGGSRIRPALVQSVLRMLTGEAPQPAIEQPRLNAVPGLVRLEPGFAPEVIAALQADGDQVLVADAAGPLLRWRLGAQHPRRRGRSAARRGRAAPGLNGVGASLAPVTSPVAARST